MKKSGGDPDFFAPSATIDHAYNDGVKEVDVFLLVTLEG